MSNGYVLPVGSYPGEFLISDPASPVQNLSLPKDIGDKKIHIVLEVKDNASLQLVSYRRVILSK